jgi:hypothetical protein
MFYLFSLINQPHIYIYIKGTNAKNFTAHNQLKTEKMIRTKVDMAASSKPATIP